MNTEKQVNGTFTTPDRLAQRKTPKRKAGSSGTNMMDNGLNQDVTATVMKLAAKWLKREIRLVLAIFKDENTKK